MSEGARYAHLWDSMDPQWLEDNQVFWVLFQSSMDADINSQPRLSPTMYDRYKGISTFQVTLHNVQIKAHKEKAWNSLPYMVMDEEIDNVIVLSPPN